MVEDLFAANERYAQSEHPTGLTGRAARGIAVVTCIDSRIEPLAMLGLAPGDAKILRNAGARVTDDMLRSLVLATNLLDVRTILLIQHTDCRMTTATDEELREQLGARHGVDASGWEFLTIRDQAVALVEDEARIRDCALIDDAVDVVTAVYDVESGRITPGRAPNVKVHWFLPTGGDSRDVLPTGADAHRRAPDHSYLAQVAQACDRLGYDAVLTPCGTGCEDAWLATAALLPVTRRLRFLVAFRPALLTPTLAAQMASTYQRLSGGRLLVNIVTGAEPAELARFGVHEDKQTRYEQTGEFLEVLRGAWRGEPFDFAGEHYQVEGATTRAVPDPLPEIYFGGASDAAETVAARHVDVYLAWGEPPAMVSERVERMRERAATAGRTLRFGIRFHVIARDTAAEAWAEADRLLAGMDPDAVAAAQADFATTQSEGQRRMAELASGERLEVHPNVWAGIGRVRGGVGTALVGSHAEIAERMLEYHALGFDEFILSGYPHLEEAYRFGEGVMPRLRASGHLPPLETGDAPVFSFR